MHKPVLGCVSIALACAGCVQAARLLPAGAPGTKPERGTARDATPERCSTARPPPSTHCSIATVSAATTRDYVRQDSCSTRWT